MSLPYRKKDSFENALKDKYIKKFHYSTFENITRISSGAFGTVYRANSTNLGKHVALKSLHENENENGELFYEKFVRELTNIMAVNNHDNIINFYGISIDSSTETYYLVLQYAKDGNLRTYLRNNFKILDWKTKINMAKDITSGLRCIHDENIVHKDLHSKNILVHERKLLITDLGLSQSSDTNSNSMVGGMVAYTDPKYLRDPTIYKRKKESDIYSLGVLFWELSSGIPPFNNIDCFRIYSLVVSGKREAPINETPKDYINIYSSAWENDPNQRPTIKNIFDSLENINLENIYNETNDNQLEAYINNQSQASMDVFNRDSISIASSNWKEVTARKDQESSTIPTSLYISLSTSLSASLSASLSTSLSTTNDYNNETKDNQIAIYNYNDFKNLKKIGKGRSGMIYSATLMNGKRKVALKSKVVVTEELFVNEIKQYSRASSHENIIGFYGISQKDSKSNECILVLEYANGGTLRDYLKSNFKKLEWSNKLNLAKQIVKAIEHLHSNDVTHGDLHSENILLHDNTIKISISRLITESSIDSKNVLESIEYSDPMVFKRLGKYSKTKASDIYSIGILLWEISSGKIPFESKFQDELDLIIYISQGNREDPIVGTPQDFINIYQDCWNLDPNQRPNIEKVMQDLEHVNLTKIFVESIELNTLKTFAIVPDTTKIKIAVGEAVKPFVPLIESVTIVISEIFAIYETVQYNKKICNSLMDRVNAAEAAIKTLKRRQAENEKNFRNQEYFKSFIRFIDIMKRIKNFIADVSNLNKYQKFLHSGSVKDRFDSLVNDFDVVMTELHFTMAIANEEQRMIDQLALKSDIADMTKFLEKIGGGIIDQNQKINIVLHEVSLMKERLNRSESLDKNIKAIETKSTELGRESIESNILKTSAIRPDITKNVSNIAGSIKKKMSTEKMASAATIGDCVQPFVPLFDSVNLVISEIITVYETVQYNKKICNSLMDRVDAAVAAIKTLKRRQAENEINFRNQEYFKSFIRFIDIMKRIKNFIADVSNLNKYQKFLHSSSVKDRFDSLAKDFDVVMTELHFTTAVANDEQRRIDKSALESDVDNMTKFLEKIDDDIIDQNQKINIVLQEVSLMKERLDHPDSSNKTEIKSTELGDPFVSKATDRRGKSLQVFKKIYKNFEVACKPINLQNEDFNEVTKIQGELAILEKLRDAPNIIRFYGLSNVDNSKVMVFEWADHGSLRELYCKYDIAWHGKVRIALDICRGLTFLHSREILHHDIRCENIMMTARLDVRIANFKYSCMLNNSTSDMMHLQDDLIHWLAPEKMRSSDFSYTFKCEVFSFGMLLWELIFRKIPYEKWTVMKVKEHVMAGNRVKITWGKAPPDVQTLQKGLAKIIVSAWHGDPANRASLQDIFMNLAQLAHVYCTSDKEIASIILPNKELDLNGSLSRAVSISDEGGLGLLDFEFNIDEMSQTIPLEEGIASHKRKEYQRAWNCFVAHADLGDAIAKYWKGYYLWKGIEVEKDPERASGLFKEAADEEIANAQFRYAFSLVNNPTVKFDREIFLEYITKAADNNNPAAQFNLGEVYLNGKFGNKKDKELSIKYLRLAALNNHPKAKELLEKLGIGN
ncbi:hypothetical protein Glove_621g60 [Diversispora epigaea]|uniref:Protein kinase domain-containing protein n=1 Tax=Diversispora epigaea TaxID=1348612 RepID=A0A397G8U2_9GLOM|nr:hypothetical protein Glove_621g60 [Diversispora epigaea]